MSIEPWILVLVLANPNAEPLILKSSPEGCSAYIADVLAGGYRPNVYTAEGETPVVFSMCGPSSSIKSIVGTANRLYAPCRGGPRQICAPAEEPRRTIRRPPAPPSSGKTSPQPSKPWSFENGIR